MLQAAFGGSSLIEENTTEIVDNPIYYEPGFNLLSPLEISSPKADVIYILIRKRANDTGSSFEILSVSSISATAKDATNGENLSLLVSTNSSENLFEVNPSDFEPIVIRIDNQLNISNPELRVRVIDCSIKDTTDNSFISFRIIVDEDSQNFHYIHVDRKALTDRNTFTAFGTEAYVTLNSSSDSYVLFSPNAWLKETTKDKSHFSYPQNSIYYERQDSYNKEDYIFSLNSWSHSFIRDQVSVMNIPGYSKAGVVLVDNMLYSHIVEQGRSVSATILVTGELSGFIDTFKINFFS